MPRQYDVRVDAWNFRPLTCKHWYRAASGARRVQIKELGRILINFVAAENTSPTVVKIRL
jgi:hypothetical protein